MNFDDMLTFDEPPWEQARETLCPGSAVRAAAFLTWLEGEDEETLGEALQTLEDLRITPEIGDLPKAPGNTQAAVRLKLEETLAQQADMARGLDPEDPLALYLREVETHSCMAVPENLYEKLAQANAGGREAYAVQSAAVNGSLSRVVELAREYTGYGVLLLDLIQEGSIGLWKGILSYQGGNFEALRDWWIRHYLVRAVLVQARELGVGQRMRQAMEDYRSVDERLLWELGRNPTPEEIAEQLHMTPEAGATVKSMLDNARTMARVQESREEQEPSPEDEMAVEDTAYFQSRQRIGELLSGLREMDAKILTLRFGLEGGLPLSPQEVGARLGLTPEEVMNREAAALASLRN